MSFCLHHSKLFTRRTKFAQLSCLLLANKFPPKLNIWRVNGQTRRVFPQKLYPIKKQITHSQPQTRRSRGWQTADLVL